MANTWHLPATLALTILHVLPITTALASFALIPMPSLGHLAKTVVFGLGSTGFDVYSDIATGLSHLEKKNICRVFEKNEIIPDNCLKYSETSSPTEKARFNSTCVNISDIICEESDLFWASFTFVLVQMPTVVLFIGLNSYFSAEGNFKKLLVPLLLMLFTPFPLLLFLQQVTSIFDPSAQMEIFSSILLFAEGGLDASPQLMLLLYIIMADVEREIPWVQKASIISSLITISKTSIVLFCAESYFNSDVSTLEYSYNDSILKQHNIRGNCLVQFMQKLWTMVKISPAFLTSLLYRVSALAIITALLKQYAIVYIGFSVLLTFVVTFAIHLNQEPTATKRSAIVIGLFYALISATTITKFPLMNRKDSYPLMMGVTIAWVILHTIALTTLMILVSLSPAYHLPHWANNHKLGLLDDLPTFYVICGIIILLGPVTIITLVGLKKQVINMELIYRRPLWCGFLSSDKESKGIIMRILDWIVYDNDKIKITTGQNQESFGSDIF